MQNDSPSAPPVPDNVFLQQVREVLASIPPDYAAARRLVADLPASEAALRERADRMIRTTESLKLPSAAAPAAPPPAGMVTPPAGLRSCGKRGREGRLRAYRIKVISRLLEFYEVEADSPEGAEELYAFGHYLGSDEETLDSEVVSVEDDRP